ncbi:MAG: hypothetical protein LBN06_11315 [Prevotellaceae bacterium]|jgi:hypothetical protein|nr:hypothetical protein [Prevotellaceae bacterium]
MKKNALWLLFAVALLPSCRPSKQDRPIDREALVDRRSPRLTSFDLLSPLSVGNGKLLFTVDATGLQTFPDAYRTFTPLRTQCAALPADRQIERVHIGINFDENVGTEQISNIRQSLNMWNGSIDSHFNYAGSEFSVQTVCHPKQDMIGVSIDSRMFTGVNFDFKTDTLHAARLVRMASPDAVLRQVNYTDTARTDSTVYYLSLRWEGDARLNEEAPGRFVLKPRAPSFSLVCLFTAEEPPMQQHLPDYSTVTVAASEYWHSFWAKSAVYDFLFCTDPRASELERRIVCTQYTSAIRREVVPGTLQLSEPYRAAIAAIRRDEPDKAIDALLSDDHANVNLPPDNGLLTVVNLMCIGAEGNTKPLPGFPKDGQWKVRWDAAK